MDAHYNAPFLQMANVVWQIIQGNSLTIKTWPITDIMGREDFNFTSYKIGEPTTSASAIIIPIKFKEKDGTQTPISQQLCATHTHFQQVYSRLLIFSLSLCYHFFPQSRIHHQHYNL